MQNELLEAERCYSIIGAFFEVYNYFGAGLVESVYSGALRWALADRGHDVVRELSVSVKFKGRHVAWQRIDLVVDNRVIVELKATEKLPEFAQVQILSYLRATRYEVGLLLHVGREANWQRFIDSPKRARPAG